MSAKKTKAPAGKNPKTGSKKKAPAKKAASKTKASSKITKSPVSAKKTKSTSKASSKITKSPVSAKKTKPTSKTSKKTPTKKITKKNPAKQTPSIKENKIAKAKATHSKKTDKVAAQKVTSKKTDATASQDLKKPLSKEKENILNTPSNKNDISDMEALALLANLAAHPEEASENDMPPAVFNEEDVEEEELLSDEELLAEFERDQSTDELLKNQSKVKKAVQYRDQTIKSYDDDFDTSRKELEEGRHYDASDVDQDIYANDETDSFEGNDDEHMSVPFEEASGEDFEAFTEDATFGDESAFGMFGEKSLVSAEDGIDEDEDEDEDEEGEEEINHHANPDLDEE